MVLGAVDLAALDRYTLVDHQPFDPTIKRTEGVSGRAPLAKLPGLLLVDAALPCQERRG